MSQASFVEVIQESREASVQFFVLSKPVLTRIRVNIFANFEVRNNSGNVQTTKIKSRIVRAISSIQLDLCNGLLKPIKIFQQKPLCQSVPVITCCAILCIMNRSDDDLRKLKSILEEKERDLLLSASIGKELLDKNTKLEDKIIDLQTDLRSANENLEQLSYQLHQKNDLINILTSDDECGSENGESCVSFLIDSLSQVSSLIYFSNPDNIEIN